MLQAWDVTSNIRRVLLEDRHVDGPPTIRLGNASGDDNAATWVSPGYNSHLRHSPTTDGKHSGTSWILSMILTIWTEVQLQWAVRNAVKHGDTDDTRLGAKIAQVLRETEALYNLKHSTLPSDQVLFYPSLAIHQA